MKSIKKLLRFWWRNIIFLAVLFLYLWRKILGKRVDRLIARIEGSKKSSVAQSYLIELAIRNMRAKRNRSIVTIGGVMIGVGAIVFLVSVGYGLEKMVIGRVAKLNELKMADVVAGKTAEVGTNEEIVSRIREIKNVKEVVPMISMVAKVKFKNSLLDVMSFGVDKRYLEINGVEMVAGEMMKEIGAVGGTEGEVSGVTRVGNWVEREGEVLGTVRFTVAEDREVMVLKECRLEAEVLGVTLRGEGEYLGEEVWGEDVGDTEGQDIFLEDKTYSRWVRAAVPMWTVGEDGVAAPRLTWGGRQLWLDGCMVKNDLITWKNDFDDIEGLVLGESTESATLVSEGVTAIDSAMVSEIVVATDSAGVEWVELKKVETEGNKVKEVNFDGGLPQGEAYISSGMLKLLGVEKKQAVGQKFAVSYVIADGMIAGMSGRMQSKETEYQIRGVVDDEMGSYYYFNLADAKNLGIGTYSQIKVLTNSETDLPEVRKQIETMGLRTSSTADTVAQIEKIFGNLRMLLGFLGTIALAVASLGMFNTMTVSLLERTREVGVMKALGMLSDEVRELFLAESMIMGLGGGIGGILLGFLGGKLLTLALSSVSMVKGQGMIDLTYVPWFFIVFILAVSFGVGMITGWYPSKRAREVSALNALRYE